MLVENCGKHIVLALCYGTGAEMRSARRNVVPSLHNIISPNKLSEDRVARQQPYRSALCNVAKFAKDLVLKSLLSSSSLF